MESHNKASRTLEVRPGTKSRRAIAERLLRQRCRGLFALFAALVAIAVVLGLIGWVAFPDRELVLQIRGVRRLFELASLIALLRIGMHGFRFRVSTDPGGSSMTRCIRCDYEVDLATHKTCPECGLALDNAEATYRGTLAPQWPFEIAFLALVAIFITLAWLTFPA